MFPEFFKALRQIQPKAFICENIQRTAQTIVQAVLRLHPERAEPAVCRTRQCGLAGAQRAPSQREAD